VAGVDLHVHTTASDGRYSPEDIVHKANDLELSFLGICDHDTVDGIAPALAAARTIPTLRLIPGVEISTDVPHGEVHILGYFIDHTDPELLATLKRLRYSRERRALGMITKLKGLGVYIEWERVQAIAGSGALGRPHIAQAMLEKGYISSPREAFLKYIGRDGPAYVEREKLTPVESVELVLKSSGLPVLAHPSTMGELEPLLGKLIHAGLVGIEAYYGGYTPTQIEGLASLARRFNLIATGGSDYHGIDDSTETMMGNIDVPLESAHELIALARRRGLKLAQM